MDLVFLNIVQLIKYRCRYFLIVVTRFPESRTNSRFLSAFNQDSVEGPTQTTTSLDEDWTKRIIPIELNVDTYIVSRAENNKYLLYMFATKSDIQAVPKSSGHR